MSSCDGTIVFTVQFHRTFFELHTRNAHFRKCRLKSRRTVSALSDRYRVVIFLPVLVITGTSLKTFRSVLAYVSVTFRCGSRFGRRLKAFPLVRAHFPVVHNSHSEIDRLFGAFLSHFRIVDIVSWACVRALFSTLDVVRRLEDGKARALFVRCVSKRVRCLR